ncbi:MAG: hypothetical protein AB1489_29965 [Acidobacteriota bacterium]
MLGKRLTIDLAARRLHDKELIEQFAAIEHFNDDYKLAIKKILSAMIIKHKLEAVLPNHSSSDSSADR